MRHIFRGFLTAALIGPLAVAVSAAAPVQAASPIAGFADSSIGSFSKPTTVEWLPDDRIVVLEQGGRVRIGNPGGSFTTALTITDICSNGERGLLGFTHDPAFLSNGNVFVYYTRDAAGAPGGCVSRVSRFRMAGSVIEPASEVVLIDNISSVNTNHNGGDLDIGSDGFLYVAIGDAGRDPRGNSGSNNAAQDRSLLNGKILRITLDGRPAPGNPLTGPGTAQCATRGNTPSTPTSECQELFAWGLRNPFRIAFDRNDGSNRFFINDVGQSTQEEVDVGAIGANYGWPMREGVCPQGDTAPCAGPAAGLTDPITSYGRSLGTYITAGAFIPNGLWPAEYDGGYLFADGGSGQIWLRRANGSVDYDAPFATGAHGITDMTFGFDTNGRMVLYYVGGGSLRAITPTSAPATPTTAGLKVTPITPVRAYDTGHAVGVASGSVFNGTTRLIDLNPAVPHKAALVNLTYAATSGVGFIRTWGTRALRPATSSLNAEGPMSFVANSAIVPLDADGTFLLESSTTGRVVVDVMAWLDEAGGATDDGRFVAMTPVRLADTRQPAGTALPSGSTNPWTAAGESYNVKVAGLVGVPNDGTVAAVAMSIAALSDGPGGWAGAHPGGSVWPGTSNVNAVNGDTRANVVVVPLGGDGSVDIRTFNIANVVIDVVGYLTSNSAPPSTSGLFSFVTPARLVDTRVPVGFGRLGALTTATIAYPDGTSVAAAVHNLTAVRTSAGGYVAAHPSNAVPVVSNVNFNGPSQTRAALAFTQLGSDGAGRFTASVPTDFIVDLVGVFSK